MSRIVNVCLYGPVTDGWSYQDNLLPKYQKLNGNDVIIITSKWIYDTNGQLILSDKTKYINENGIKTIRLGIINDKPLNYKFKRYKGFRECLEKEKPEILFIHGCQFLDIFVIVDFLKCNRTVRVYVDNHCDFSNSATTWFSKNILHKIIWRCTTKSIEPYVSKFYGVTPARVAFLHDMYGISQEKISLLVMGIDDEIRESICTHENIKGIKSKYDISKNDFIIVTGGKIDKAKKQILTLMNSCGALQKINPRLKLLVFGSIEKDLELEFNELLRKYRNITYVGFINSKEAMLLLKIADLAVFPGRHSVYWEETVGLGIPMVVKYWKGTTHIDMGGNVEFLYEDSIREIMNVVGGIIENPNKLSYMRKIAEEKGITYFSYKEIARKSIDSGEKHENNS